MKTRNRGPDDGSTTSNAVVSAMLIGVMIASTLGGIALQAGLLSGLYQGSENPMHAMSGFAKALVKLGTWASRHEHETIGIIATAAVGVPLACVAIAAATGKTRRFAQIWPAMQGPPMGIMLFAFAVTVFGISGTLLDDISQNVAASNAAHAEKAQTTPAKP